MLQSFVLVGILIVGYFVINSLLTGSTKKKEPQKKAPSQTQQGASRHLNTTFDDFLESVGVETEYERQTRLAEEERNLTDEQRGYIRAFYCQGGLDYEKMNKPSKMAMKMLITILNKKKDPTEKDKAMVEMISHSYDISDEKYIEPIVEYVIG